MALVAVVPRVVDFQYDPHGPKNILEFVEKRFPAQAFGTHLEQKPHANLVLIRLRAMFGDNFVVCLEERTERETFNMLLLLGASDDLIEETDICQLQAVLEVNEEQRQNAQPTLI